MAEILQYVPGNGIFHRLHPVTKILFIILVSVVTILTSSIAVLAGILLLIFLLAFAGHLLRPVIQQMVMILAMSIVIFLITILTVTEGEVVGYLIPSFIPVIGGSIPITVGALTVGDGADPSVRHPDLRIPALRHLHPAPRPGAYHGAGPDTG